VEQPPILNDDEPPRFFVHRRRRVHGCLEERLDRRSGDGGPLERSRRAPAVDELQASVMDAPARMIACSLIVVSSVS
jgi:hypothetical protein